MRRLIRCLAAAALLVPVAAWSQEGSAQGKITYLRANELNDAFGNLQAEAVIQLGSLPGWGLGLRLQNDAALPANRAMFDLLSTQFHKYANVFLS